MNDSQASPDKVTQAPDLASHDLASPPTSPLQPAYAAINVTNTDDNGLDDFTKDLLLVAPDRSPVKGKSPFAILGTNFAKPALEVALLAAFSGSFASFVDAIKTLRPGDFYVDTNRKIFEAMVALYNNGTAVTAQNIINHLAALDPQSLEIWTNHVETMKLVSTQVKKVGYMIREIKAAAAIRGGDDYCPDHYSESFCAELFNLKAGAVRCVDKIWRRYDEGAWMEIAPTILYPLAVRSIHPEHLDSRRVMGIIELVRMKRQVPGKIFKGAIKISKGSILVNTRYCVVKLTARGTPVRIRHSPDFNFTRTIAAAFDPQAKCPLFTEKLEEMLPDPEDRELLQFFCGSVLYPSSEHETALVAYGPGGTGKSTVALVIREVLGADNVGSAGLEELCSTSSYVLPTLKWKLVNIGSELRGSEEVESANFKKLVTGETMNVRAIYRDPEDMTTTCKFMFLSNNLPRFKDGTDAELRRLRILHFNQKPKNLDPKLKEKLAAETSGIFNWMLEGLAKLMTQKAIPLGGKAAQAVLNSFNKDNDKVGAFVSERCMLGPGGTVSKKDLFEAFGEWCEDNGHSAEKLENYFFKRLAQRYPELKSSRLQLSGTRTHCYNGIAIASPKTEAGSAIQAKLEEIRRNASPSNPAPNYGPVVEQMLQKMDLDPG